MQPATLRDSEPKTFYPNYVKIGFIGLFGCAVLFFAFFVWFMETRSPSIELREVLFRGFLLRLGETQLYMLLLLVAYTYIGRVRIGATGIYCSDYFGLPVFLAWDDMSRIQTHAALGVEYIRIYPPSGLRFMSLPVFVFHRQQMIDTIKSLAPPENVLRQHWNNES